MADEKAGDGASDFLKQLGENVLKSSVPKAGLAALDTEVKSLVIQTRSALLPTITIDRPFASGDQKPTIAGGSPGLLESLRPKVTAYGPDGASVLTWAPYGEPGKRTVGEPEGKAIGAAAFGLGCVFGLGWWLGHRSGAKKARRLLTAKR
jgi:hypothetical protein